ncbi:MAG: ABC transporter substrate-binding protein [Lachnospiraceae bacterium]
MTRLKLEIIVGLLIVSMCCGGCIGREQEIEEDSVVELTFFIQKREVEDFFLEVIEKYNASQDKVRVVRVSSPYSSQYLKIHAAEDTLPDIVQVTGIQDANTMMYVQNKMFLPLTDMDCVQCLEEPYQQMSYYQNEIYVVPVSVNVMGIYVNLDLLEEYQLELPTTWSQWINELQQVKAQGKEALLMTDGDGWSTQSICCNMMVSINEENYDYSEMMQAVVRREIRLEEIPAFVDMLDGLRELHEYANQDYLVLSYDDAIERFVNGDALFFCQGSWVLPSLLRANPDMNVIMIPFPQDKYKVGMSMDMSLAISRNCEHVEEAQDFLNYMLSNEIAQSYADYDCSISCIKGVEDGGKTYFSQVYEQIEQGNYAYEIWAMPDSVYNYMEDEMVYLFYKTNATTSEQFLSALTELIAQNGRIE